MTGKHHPPSWWRHLLQRWRERRQVSRPRPRLVSAMVDGAGWEHLVTHDNYEQGLRERSGFYQAVCGRRIAVGGMTAPPLFPCHPCKELEPRT